MHRMISLSIMKRAHVEDAKREKEELRALLLIQSEQGVERE
jgi:hypothetical protein